MTSPEHPTQAGAEVCRVPEGSLQKLKYNLIVCSHVGNYIKRHITDV